MGLSLNFGSVRIGGCSTIQAVVQHVVNTGPATVSLSVPTPFSLPDGTTFTVSNSQYAPVAVRFCPTAAGTFTQSVAVTGATAVSTLSLMGTGVGQAAPPAFVTQAKVDAISTQQVDVPFPVRITTGSSQNAGKTISVRSTTGVPLQPNSIQLDAGGGWSGQMTVKRAQKSMAVEISGQNLGGVSNVFEAYDKKNFDQTTKTSPTPKGAIRIHVKAGSAQLAQDLRALEIGRAHV